MTSPCVPALLHRDSSGFNSSSLKLMANWVSSAFDDVNDFGIKTLKQESRSSKRQRQDGNKSTLTKNGKKPTPSTDLLADKFTPQTQTDLAVHKKKIAEVQSWLHTFTSSNHNKGGPILLLTGPSGAGKTTTVKVLAKESNIEVQEWTNPTTEIYRTDREFNPHNMSTMDGPMESQLKIFENFLLRANKYSTLEIFGEPVMKKKIILIEDYPNIFFRDTTGFHNILRRYKHVGHCPLVFIVSDTSHGDSNERLLFSKQIQIELTIHNISFNALAPTSLTKVLTRIANTECNQGPTKATIDNIVSACAGDVRGAINALQFTGVMDTSDAPVKNNKKVSKKSAKSSKLCDSQSISIGTKDVSLFIFRALGKVLHCKRGKPTEIQDRTIKTYRDPLLVKPEDVIGRCNLSGDMFTAYLHENFLEFFDTIHDVSNALEYISDSDHLTVNWTSRASQQNYASVVAARGIMFTNSSMAYSEGKSVGWKPLHKPQSYASNTKARDNSQAAKALFRYFHSPPVELQTELLPYLYLTGRTVHDPGQINFLQDLCTFQRQRQTKRWHEKLDENDFECLDENKKELSHARTNKSDDISNSQTVISQKEEDEIEISDFEGDF